MMDRMQQNTTAGMEKAISALSPETFVRNWQQNTVRVMRAQERMMQGMVAAARIEMRFGQEMLASRVGLFKWDGAQVPPVATENAAQDMEKLITVIRDVTEELRTGFTEATKLLTEGAEPKVQEAVEQATEVAEDASHKAEDATASTIQAGADATRRAASTIRTRKAEGAAPGTEGGDEA